MIESILIAFSCGLVDRLRGDGDVNVISKTVEAFIYGMMVAVLLGGFIWWQILLFSALWTLGASFGWGTPMGAALHNHKMKIIGNEWWQVGKLEKSTMLALIARGALWGACIMPMYYFNHATALVAFAMPVIFPLAIYVAKLDNYVIKGDTWARQEFCRGWLVGLVALLTGLL